MYVVIALLVVVLAALALAGGGYRVLKAAHTRPPAAGSSPGTAGHAHSRVERPVLGAIGRAITLLVRLGVPLGPVRLLTVRGRVTGLPRTNPVDLFAADGGYWLIATHDDRASWVMNLRAAGEGTLTRGRQRLAFTATELPPQEAAAAFQRILGPRLARRAGGFVLRETMGLAPGASPTDYARAAAAHPVFRLSVTTPGAARPAAVAPAAQAPPSGRSRRSARTATAIIVAGLLIAAAHLVLGVTSVMTRPAAISGVVVGLVLAGLGNHYRIFVRH